MSITQSWLESPTHSHLIAFDFILQKKWKENKQKERHLLQWWKGKDKMYLNLFIYYYFMPFYWFISYSFIHSFSTIIGKENQAKLMLKLIRSSTCFKAHSTLVQVLCRTVYNSGPQKADRMWTATHLFADLRSCSCWRTYKSVAPTFALSHFPPFFY